MVDIRMMGQLYIWVFLPGQMEKYALKYRIPICRVVRSPKCRPLNIVLISVPQKPWFFLFKILIDMRPLPPDRASWIYAFDSSWSVGHRRGCNLQFNTWFLIGSLSQGSSNFQGSTIPRVWTKKRRFKTSVLANNSWNFLYPSWLENDWSFTPCSSIEFILLNVNRCRATKTEESNWTQQV